jgi:hypothetical protein
MQDTVSLIRRVLIRCGLFRENGMLTQVSRVREGEERIVSRSVRLRVCKEELKLTDCRTFG